MSGARGSLELLAWLRTRPPLDELVASFPEEWQSVKDEVHGLLARDNPDELIARFRSVSQPASPRPGGKVPPARERVTAEVRRQMTIHLLKKAVLRSSAGSNGERVRFNLINGSIAQRLLFRRDLERKPVNLWLFRMAWPLLPQRRLLMPLVQPRGIWCFYSAPLVERLADLIDGRRCLEIAAGDGTLSRFLADAGVEITPTDDHSWSDVIDFPPSVVRQDARSALKEHRPQVVICSWPPAGNSFERHVFNTDTVEQYIVISSASEHSTGNWASYRRQTSFAQFKDESLSRLVLPPEVDHAVYIFTRKFA